MVKIGVFGGTFNPIHFGHLRAAEEAREAFGLDKVLFIPAGNPPLKPENITAAAKRFEMAKIATEGNPAFEVLDIECSRPGKSYIVETLEELAARYRGATLYFMLGIDAFLDIPNWCRPGQITSMVDFIILSRPGRYFKDLQTSPYLDAGADVLGYLDSGRCERETVNLLSGRKAVLLRIMPYAISSTDIRRRLQAGQSTKYLLPEKVESFIISNGLYRTDN
ncbi:MAG: nicotinic acid mononucleotide adenylyltransferase [Thermodesulfovibrio sp.]|nr:nicotinic acid mononucleotide adenylyltransferase [Thermodesulfovibrio sp.]